jgi:hypothetical protein
MEIRTYRFTISKQAQDSQFKYIFWKAKWNKKIGEDMFSPGTTMLDWIGEWRDVHPAPWRLLAPWRTAVSWNEINCYFIIRRNVMQIICYGVRSIASIKFETGAKLQRIEELVFAKGGLKSIVVPSSIEVLCESCFSGCEALSPITFQSDSHLRRTEISAFGWSGLHSIIIPSSVDMFCESCCDYCKSLS